MLEKTLTENRKVRLSTEYPVVAGVDKDNVPQILAVDEDGRLEVAIGKFNLPQHDDIVLEYYTGTNNLHTATYKMATVTVATITLTYAGGGSLDNDLLVRAQLT